MHTLQAVSHQLTIRVIPGIVPDMPVVPSDNSIKHVLLQPCLLFVTAVCKKQSHFDKVAHLARAVLHCTTSEGLWHHSLSAVLFRSTLLNFVRLSLAADKH